MNRDVQDYASKRQLQLERARQIREERIRGDKFSNEDQSISSSTNLNKTSQLVKEKQLAQNTKSVHSNVQDSGRKGPLVRKLPWEIDQQRKIDSREEVSRDITQNRKTEQNFEQESKKASLSVLKSKQTKATVHVTIPGPQKVGKRPAIEETEEETPEPPKAFYPQINDENTSSFANSDSVECSLCGRRFSSDRIEKHEIACSKSQKARKVFDSSRHRVQGTEAENYLKKKRDLKTETKAKAPKISKWKREHDEFMNMIHGSTKQTTSEEEQMDDRVPCPHCGRRFNQEASQRHINICRTVFGKKATGSPAPSKTTPASKVSISPSKKAIPPTKGKIAAMQRQNDINQVLCPHCGRKFDKFAAERHVPICGKVLSKPQPPPAKNSSGSLSFGTSTKIPSKINNNKTRL